MKRFLLLFFTLFTYAFCYSQGGAGPVQSCASPIPEICNGSLYPAATSGTATAPSGTSLNCGFSPITEYGSFYFFESNTNGPLSINITPTDVIGIPYPNINTSPDLDYICWGPFNDLSTMCDLLTNPNQEDCSNDPATTQEVLQITNAVAGEFYVILVANWAASGSTPDPCFIQFTASGPNDAFGGPSPGDAGADAGWGNPLLFCDSDPQMNLIDQLNGQPVNNGSWTYNGNSVPGTFDPAIDPPGVYTYSISGSSSGTCPGDDATVSIDVFSAASISITSPSVLCSNENSFTLTGTPPAGWSAQGNGVFTDNLGSVITDFDPASNMPGLYNITYTYTPQGCNPIPVGGSILINEAPTVLPNDVTTNNPSCFGYNDGSALLTASSGQPAYVFNWFGENPLTLTAGTFNYTVTDANQCSFSSSVTLYDPLNTTSIINEYNSSCFGANDGAASITMLGGTTPPGTVSLLPYCASNPLPDFDGQPSTYIQHVQLAGDNSSLIDNNTIGINDFYEDYTTTMYAEITEGNLYTINVTIGDLSGGSYDGGAKVFIDYNIDGDFLDAGEDIGIIPVQAAAGTSVALNFNVPTTGAFGATRMRVVAWGTYDFTTPNDITPCESPAAGTWANPWFGATEDYSIVLNAPSFSATYLWDDGTITDSIPNLGPGTYYVIITDTETGCPIQDSAVITEPSEITFNPTITNISCNDSTDGAVTLNPSGGNGGAYNINWGAADSSALGDGIYTVTVIDPSTITSINSVACFNDTTIEMIEPAYFSVDFSVSEDTICLNDPVTLDFNFNQAGITPFNISYTVGGINQSSGTLNNNGIHNISISPSVGNNNYIITSIIDSNGCINQNVLASQNIYVNNLPDINIVESVNPICNGDSSILLFNSSAGTPPFNVVYNSNGIPASQVVLASGSSLIVNPNVTTTYQLDSVADANQCLSILSDSITLVVNELPDINWSVPSGVCDEEIVYLSMEFINGNPPWSVTYSINNTEYNFPPTLNTIDSLSILPSNNSTYGIVSLTDGNDCKEDINEDLTIISYPLPEGTVEGGGSICNNGSTTDIIFTISTGTPPYTLNYYSGIDQNQVANIGYVYTLPTSQSGIFTINEIVDSRNCKAKTLTGSAQVIVNPLPEANITAYPQVASIIDPLIYFIDNSEGHITGMWNFDDTYTLNSNFDKLTHMYRDTGTFEVSLQVESDSGCIDIAYQTIIINPSFTIYIPNSFTPNNDLKNDFFLPIIDGVTDYELSIYDRLGNNIYTTNKYSNDYYDCINNNCEAAWNGKVNNSELYATKGVYIYSIKLTDIKGKAKTYEGTVTLIR